MSMEEIEKLRLRVEKDPNSRLFLPLAEEYRKSGMLDEAITVVLRGLEYQPAYTSARVALGRLYLEKNMVEEARNEFENVVKTIPDNLFSHKKLAEIYKASGQTDMAIREYKKVIELNPLDDDARISLDEIEGEPVETEEIFTPALPAEQEPAAVEETADPLHVEEEPGEEILAEAEADEAFAEFKASFAPPSAEAIEEPKDFFEPPVEEVGTEDVFASGIEDEGAKDVLEAQAEDAEVIELAEDEGFEDAFSIDSEEVSPVGSHVGSEGGFDRQLSSDEEDFSAANSFVNSGNYYGAMEIYRKILTRDPENKHALQRVTELKSLLKLLGRSDEVLVGRLDSFLSAIKKNFGRSN